MGPMGIPQWYGGRPSPVSVKQLDLQELSRPNVAWVIRGKMGEHLEQTGVHTKQDLEMSMSELLLIFGMLKKATGSWHPIAMSSDHWIVESLMAKDDNQL